MVWSSCRAAESRQNVVVEVVWWEQVFLACHSDNMVAFVVRSVLYFYAEFVAASLPIDVGGLVEVKVGNPG